METSIITLKAYSIQALQTPTFELIILLGNFHLELAFFGAVRTFLADSGIEYLITEANVLAEGSLAGFMNGNSITEVCGEKESPILHGWDGSKQKTF